MGISINKNTEKMNSNDMSHLKEILDNFNFGYKYHKLQGGILILYNGFNFLNIKIVKSDTEMIDFGRFISGELLPKVIELRKEKNPLVSIKLNKFVGEMLQKGDTTNAFRAIYSEFVSPITVPLITKVGETVVMVDSNSLTLDSHIPRDFIIPEVPPIEKEAIAKFIVEMANSIRK